MKLIAQLEKFVSSKIKSVTTFLAIIQLEARLAKLSMFPFLVSLCFMFVVLTTAWMSLILLLGAGLYILLPHLIWVIFIVFVLNSLILLGIIKYLQFNLKCMSFEKTREHLFAEKTHYDKLEKKHNHSSRNSIE